MHGVAEVHELRRGADVELQALEDGDDVIALIPSAFASAGCRAGWSRPTSMATCSISSRPKAWMHQAIPERSISWLDQQQFRHQNGQFLADSAAYRLAV